MAMQGLRVVVALLFFCLSAPIFAAEKAHEFSLPAVTQTGEVNLADFKGRVVYLDFWASWCSPCRRSFPWMNEMQARYKQQGLSIVAVSVDPKRDVIDPFIKEMQPNFTVLHDSDGQIAKAYKLVGMPSSFLIDRDGNVVLTHMGFRSKDKDKLEAAIQTLLEK